MFSLQNQIRKLGAAGFVGYFRCALYFGEMNAIPKLEDHVCDQDILSSKVSTTGLSVGWILNKLIEYDPDFQRLVASNKVKSVRNFEL